MFHQRMCPVTCPNASWAPRIPFLLNSCTRLKFTLEPRQECEFLSEWIRLEGNSHFASLYYRLQQSKKNILCVCREKNSSAAESILEKVRDALETSGFVYDDSNVNIIPGEREGLTGWISVNFLNNSLKVNLNCNCSSMLWEARKKFITTIFRF